MSLANVLYFQFLVELEFAERRIWNNVKVRCFNNDDDDNDNNNSDSNNINNDDDDDDDNNNYNNNNNNNNCNDKKERKGIIIVIAVPANVRVGEKEREKVRKYRDLKREIGRLWKLKMVEVVPVVIGALGSVTKGYHSLLE